MRLTSSRMSIDIETEYSAVALDIRDAEGKRLTRFSLSVAEARILAKALDEMAKQVRN